MGVVALSWTGEKGWWAPAALPALSPFITVGSAIALRSVGFLSLLAVGIIILALFYPRWFCRYGCPMGLLQEWVEGLLSRPKISVASVPHIGKALVFLTLGGSMVGFPLFLWLDPLAMFPAFINAWDRPLSWAGLLGGLGLPLLLILDAWRPRLWCQRLCPLGATQELLAWPGRMWNRQVRCDSLPLKAWNHERNRRSERRWFFAACVGGAGAWAIGKMGGATPPPVRPPGTVDEEAFGGVCVRCGNCGSVCPSKIIQHDLGQGNWSTWLAPRVSFEAGYCQENCNRCGQVCPTGAIQRLTLEEKRREVMGLAKVTESLCWMASGKECTACIQACPYSALTIQTSEDGFSNLPRLDPSKCTGCGACEAVCPARPHRAIVVLTELNSE